jgi:hypothetical protein
MIVLIPARGKEPGLGLVVSCLPYQTSYQRTGPLPNNNATVQMLPAKLQCVRKHGPEGLACPTN